jgi:hypothetical protein
MLAFRRSALFSRRTYKVWATKNEADLESPQFVVGYDNGFLPRHVIANLSINLGASGQTSKNIPKAGRNFNHNAC